MTEVKSDTAVAASDVDIVALKPGALIGRHEVLAVLGQGGFGITYRARDGQLNRDVAIKEYLPTSLAYRADGMTVVPRSTRVAEDFTWGRDRFVAEGQTLASLHHAPGIVRVFDFLEINGTAYIVMELLRGDTLEARLKREGPLDPASVDGILSTLLDGLEQVHATGFLHRDIKPANILLDGKGRPTLIDFGASRAAMAGRTVAMTAIFTPGYAATEQMTSAKQGPWTDIYGLSATLYHAITGKAPPNAFDRLLDDAYEPLARIAPPGFAPGLIAGIDAGLAVRASDRPQSIAGWRAILSMVSPADGAATQHMSRTIDPAATIVSRSPTVQPARSTPAPAALPPAADVAPPPTPPARSRTPLYAGIAAAVLLLAGGGGWLALSPANPVPPSAPGKAAALQDMKVEDLERVLAERRAADAAAADKKRLEEEARRKAEADAASKLAADAELVKAEAARRQAEDELAKLKAEIEARRQDDTQAQALARRAEAEAAQRKAEAEMAALRQAEDDARRKAAAEAAAKHEADESLAKAQAERRKADEEARRKAAAETREKSEASAKQIAEAEAKAKVEAEAETKAKADTEAKARAKAEADAAAAADKKAAESAETALRLALPDRQRVQVALTSLGFDTRGNDGAFGPRTRETIAAWQKAHSRSSTGFLDGTQHQALLREAAPALQKYDEDQKKKEDEEKKKAEEDAKAKAAAAAAAPPPAPPPTAAASGFDGTYGGAFATPSGNRPTTVRIAGATARGSLVNAQCGTASFTLNVAPSGEVTGGGIGFDRNCGALPFSLSGRAGGGRLQLNLTASGGIDVATSLVLGAATPAPTATGPAPAPPAAPAATAPATTALGGSTAYDGRWSGTAMLPSGATQPLSVAVRNGAGSGSWRNPRCGGDVTFTVAIQPGGAFTVVLNGFNQGCQRGTNTFGGTVQGNTIAFTFGGGSSFSLTR